ncbi:MAG TPA: HlyD family efflux transporter periplasmic adaptor subunit [Acidimicrobiales bacterium]|nr:HlyD family efflux transporter periplasmic adaptor subunit [Acidimicrobiales bacterium]
MTTTEAPSSSPSSPSGGGGLFRKQAKARLEAAEKLDTMLAITSARLWIVLVTCILLITAAVAWTFLGTASATVQATGILLPSQGVLDISSSVPGVVTDLPYDVGVQVAAQESIATITNSSGSQVSVDTAVSGTIVAQYVSPGAYVAAGQPIAEIFPLNSPISGIMFVSATSGKSITVGMQIDISPSTAPSAQYGTVIGRVASVSPLPLSTNSLQQLVGNRPGLLDEVAKLGSVLEVVASLDRDINTLNGYKWTSGSGPPYPITPGTLLTGQVILANIHPSSIAF